MSATAGSILVTDDGMDALRDLSLAARGRFWQLLGSGGHWPAVVPEDAELISAGWVARAVDGVRLTPQGLALFPAADEQPLAEFKSQRDQARDSMPCSKCGALAGEPCKGWRGDRISVHAERIVLWRAVRNRRNGRRA